MLKWLDLPAAERPTFIALYFSDVDDAGHADGPDSEAVREAVERADGYLGRLLSGLEQRGLTDRVNVVVVSDHGMAAVSNDRVIVLDDYISLDDVVISDINPTVGLFPKPGKEDAVFQALVNAHPRLRVYRRSETPEGWHYRDHPRIPPIIGVVDEGWQIIRRTTLVSILERRISPAGGQHGYDPAVMSMRGVFLLMADLRKQDIVTKVRTLKSGATVGGIPFTRGPLAHLLRNRFYIGEVMFKGEVLAGEQPAIVDRGLFDVVQTKLTKQVDSHKTARVKSEAVLAGRIFDDRGNRMTPSHVRKRGIKYRYYLSSALLQGQPERAGAVSRIPAAEIEGLVLRSVREHLNPSADIEDAVLINTHVGRVEIQSDQLLIELTNAKGTSCRRNTLKVPWHKTPLKRRREILVPASVPPQDVRAIRSEKRALLVSSIARGRRWLNELITDPTANAKSIATRDGCSVRKVNMTISFAFLAPDLVKAAIEGRLPHGMGVVRLADLPAEWSRQYRMLGLPAQ